MRRQLAARGTTLAVLFVVRVLGHDKFRLQRHDPVMSGRDNRGGEHGVEIFGLVLAAFALLAVRAMDCVRAMEFRSVQRD